MNKPNNPQAFPYYLCEPNGSYVQAGMTLRDYFAAKAMQGFLSNSDLKRELSYREIAEKSYLMARAMLEEREKNA